MWKCKECGGEVVAVVEQFIKLDKKGNFEESRRGYLYERNEEIKYELREYQCLECDEHSYFGSYSDLKEIADWEE